MIERGELAQIHSVVVPFLGGLIGFAFAKVVIPGAHGTPLGIALTALIYALLGKVIDLVLSHPSAEENDWFDPVVLWFVTLVISFALLVPVSAILAPDYRLHGLVANLAAIVLVYAADSLVSRASPWGGISPELREKLRSR